jgi:nucleoside-diphosphate-sugar epimerase
LTISVAAGFRGKIYFNANRYTGPKEKFLDATKLREKYKMEIPHELAPGIRRTVEWYSKHFDELDGRRKFSDT